MAAATATTTVPRQRQALATATRSALLDARLAEFAGPRFRGGVDPSDRCRSGNASATDQLSLRVEGGTLAGRGRPPLRATRQLGAWRPRRAGSQLGDPGGVRRQHPCIRAGRRRAARAESDHGAGGDDRLRAPALDRRTPHPSAVLRRGHVAAARSASDDEVVSIDEVVLYHVGSEWGPEPTSKRFEGPTYWRRDAADRSTMPMPTLAGRCSWSWSTWR